MRNLIRGIAAALLLAMLPLASNAAVFVSVAIAPPVLPVYVQPPCPAPGYIWIPGYWAWDDDYYWVPGTWELAPEVGFLWTPGYWGWSGGFYLWHAGYWGPHVGFYGGINYGFGYGGVGYEGGYWRGDQFYYNRSVTNINTTNITNVYNRTVVNNVTVSHASFNGGAGGVAARPTAAEISADRERHIGFTPAQRQQEQTARSNDSLRARVNGGHPAIAATPRPGAFSGRGIVAAHGADRPPAAMNRSERTPGTMNRAERTPGTMSRSEHAPAAAVSRTDRPPQAQRPEFNRGGSAGAAHENVQHPAQAYTQRPRGGYENAPRAPQGYSQPPRGGFEGGQRAPQAYSPPPRSGFEGASRAPQGYAQAPRGGFEGGMRGPQSSPQGRAPQNEARPAAAPQGGERRDREQDRGH